MSRRVVIVFMMFSAILGLFGCDYHRVNNRISLPKYLSEECYWGEGFQDHTDYCKYSYDENTIKQFETHAQFDRVADSDIDNIKSYFENFGERIIDQGNIENYDFDFQSQVKENDYFCIITDGEREVAEGVFDKFYSYNVYYVDMSKCILYFIHSNT